MDDWIGIIDDKLLHGTSTAPKQVPNQTKTASAAQTLEGDF
jgi:hypothetical protein